MVKHRVKERQLGWGRDFGYTACADCRSLSVGEPVDPRREVEAAVVRLKPGGILLVRTPEADSWARRRYGVKVPGLLVLWGWTAWLNFARRGDQITQGWRKSG